MAVKILSRSGVSLAGTYDVQGSRAHVQLLESREVTLVHEMGATMVSERYSQFIRRSVSTAIGQSTAWAIFIDDLPAGVFRIYGIRVFGDVASRQALVSVAVRDLVTDREMPIWSWDSATDGETLVRFSNDGGAVAAFTFYQPSPGNVQLPHMMSGPGQPQRVSSLVVRGVTTAFGAGNLVTSALIHIGFTDVGSGLSSLGLPVIGW